MAIAPCTGEVCFTTGKMIKFINGFNFFPLLLMYVDNIPTAKVMLLSHRIATLKDSYLPD